MEGITSLRAVSSSQGDWDNSSVTSGFRPVGKERVRGDEIDIPQVGFKGKEEYEALACAEDDQECEQKEVELNRYYVKMCSNRDAQKYVQKSHGTHVLSSNFNNKRILTLLAIHYQMQWLEIILMNTSYQPNSVCSM